MLVKSIRKKEQEKVLVYSSVLLSLLALAGVFYFALSEEGVKESIGKAQQDVVNEVEKQESACNVSLEAYVGKIIEMRGTVVEISDDYVSKSGSVYQQFYLSDNCSRLLVFKKVESKRVKVEIGQNVSARGMMKEWNGEYELYNPEIMVG